MPDPPEIRPKISRKIRRRHLDCPTKFHNSISSKPRRLFVTSNLTKFHTFQNVGTSFICRSHPESVTPCELSALPVFRHTTTVSTETFPLVRAVAVTVANPTRTVLSLIPVHRSQRNQGPSPDTVASPLPSLTEGIDRQVLHRMAVLQPGTTSSTSCRQVMTALVLGWDVFRRRLRTFRRNKWVGRHLPLVQLEAKSVCLLR
jgi:hypothetical protein